MNSKLQQTLIAGAIMALATSPTWAASDTYGPPAAAPQVESGQPMDSAPSMDTAPQMDSAPQTDTTSGTAFSDNPLYTSTPDDLRRVKVVDAAGEKVGKVKTIVLGPDRDSAHAVISAGGFLGLGAREIVVSLDELQLIDDTLHAGGTRDALLARGDYDPAMYVELQPETPIREFSAFEPIKDKPEPAMAPPVPAERK